MFLIEFMLLFIFALCLETCWTKNAATPLWKSLLVHHPSWTGYLEDSNGRYISSFRTLSVQQEHDGLAYVEVMLEQISIEMIVSSDDDRLVVFKEELMWNKSATHFADHSNLEFRGEFISDHTYYKYLANVSSTEAKNFATITLLPEGKALNQQMRHNPSSKAGLYVGIPVILAVIVIGLGVMTLVWGFRKGYLRHIPWSYKIFSNSDTSKREGDIKLDSRTNQSSGQEAEEPAVHI